MIGREPTHAEKEEYLGPQLPVISCNRKCPQSFLMDSYAGTVIDPHKMDSLYTTQGPIEETLAHILYFKT